MTIFKLFLSTSFLFLVFQTGCATSADRRFDEVENRTLGYSDPLPKQHAARVADPRDY